jgi:hypothetical protein
VSAGASPDRELDDAVLNAGDEAAFRALYRRYTPRLYRMALRMAGGDARDAELTVRSGTRPVATLQGVPAKETPSLGTLGEGNVDAWHGLTVQHGTPRDGVLPGSGRAQWAAH